jgi:hypothetical protein
MPFGRARAGMTTTPPKPASGDAATVAPCTTSMWDYPPRIARLHEELSRVIPCNPDRPDVRAELAAFSLSDLLIKYTNWANRFIPTRKREVVYGENFWNDGRALAHAAGVLRIANEVEAGDDLTPRISTRVHTHGYVPARFDSSGRQKGPEWGDKDFALNAYDVHHLHLSRNGGHGRDLLYVGFTRERAIFLFVGDHNSFDDGSVAQAAARWHTGGNNIRMPYLDKELSLIHRAGLSTMNVVDGRVYIGTALSSDGSSTFHWARHLWKVLRQWEPMLDDPARRGRLFTESGRVCPDEPEFIWRMQGCDLELVEMRSRVGFACAKWRR